MRELRGSALIALHPVMRSLRVLQFDSANARYREGITDAWQDLLLGPERPIERLCYDGLDTQREWDGLRWRRTVLEGEVEALLRWPALPQLRELEIRESDPSYITRIWTAPVIKRLHTLGFELATQGGFSLAPFAHAFVAAPVPTLHFLLRPGLAAVGSRVADRDAQALLPGLEAAARPGRARARSAGRVRDRVTTRRA
ncbi:MAG: hypothetical protein WKG01_38110 [Kofleriaceae bacterium]